MKELLAPSSVSTTTKDFSKHPCFNKEAKGSCGRVHLPVAPKCNIQCNFCNRKYDCVNESRPGVTSAVLSPAQAVHYMDKVLAKEPRITVVGIAGPGDPMANASQTLDTMRRLNKKHPQLLFCLSTNGLGLPAHVDEMAEVGVSHVTVTVNAVDPEIGASVYAWVKDGNVMYKGLEGARLLLSRQLEGIRRCKELGMVVKVNTIVIPGVNEHHIEDIARTMKELGVDVLNCMGLKPVAGTIYENIEEPNKAKLDGIRNTMEQYLPQMRHCQRCRADAVGLLTQDRTKEMAGCLSACSKMELPMEEARPYVAVCTQEGLLVNRHLGEADRFQIWSQQAGGAYALVEERPAPSRASGPKRWLMVAELLKDCKAVLCSAMGATPRAVLEESGLACHEMQGLIDQGLAAVYGHGDLSLLRKQKGGCKMGCGGGGEGC
ncbi:nitrogenase cofactor biosynthesis protein NifB [Megalodesulfovibrio paquesii]